MSANPIVPDKAALRKKTFKNGDQPTDLSITLGSAPCNHACLFCPQSVLKPKKAEWLDLKLLEKVLHEIPEENLLLNVSSYSETLSAPNLVPAIQLMKKIRPKLEIVMASNGTVFREKVVADLIDAGLDWYSYSFDGATREDYLALMQVDHFDVAWKNLEKIVEMRNRKNSKMKITTHVMAFEGREAAMQAFRDHWQTKLDRVFFRDVSNWGADSLGLMRRLKEKGFVPRIKAPEKRYPCSSIFMHMAFDPTGEYYPCIAAVPAYPYNTIHALGHAATVTFDEAWQKLGELRRDHLNGEWDKHEACRTCDLWARWDDLWEHSPGASGGETFSLGEEA